MSRQIDANSWEFLQRIIRIGHNRRVKKYFKDISSDDDTRTGRAAIKTALLIRDNDSALECLNKQVYFQNNLDQKEIINTFPEDYQVRAEVDRPQLIVIFKPEEKSRSNDQYPLTIPHYKGDKTPRIKRYYKGNFWARAKLKDNSHIRVNGRTKTEAISVVKDFLREVDSRYRLGLDNITTGEYINKPFAVLKMSPYRADFYKNGKLDDYPTWQHFF